jgi:hypothetical protein
MGWPSTGSKSSQPRCMWAAGQRRTRGLSYDAWKLALQTHLASSLATKVSCILTLLLLGQHPVGAHIPLPPQVALLALL